MSASSASACRLEALLKPDAADWRPCTERGRFPAQRALAAWRAGQHHDFWGGGGSRGSTGGPLCSRPTHPLPLYLPPFPSFARPIGYILWLLVCALALLYVGSAPPPLCCLLPVSAPLLQRGAC
jgi:hypothetical protein